MNRNGNTTGSKPIESGFPPTLIIVMEGKGGVGKSVTADAINFSFTSEGYMVGGVETDTTNSNQSSIHEGVLLADTSEAGWRSAVGVLAKQKRNGSGPHIIIMDVGARDEVHVRGELGYFTRVMADVGGQVLVIRPVTTSSFAQANAIDFAMTTAGSAVAVVFMQMRAQGRKEHHFARWSSTKSLAAAKQAGACDTWIDDLGVEIADEAVGFGLSFAAVASENFAKAGEDADEARAFFDDRKVEWVQSWLEDQKARWLPVFRQALANRRAGRAEKAP